MSNGTKNKMSKSDEQVIKNVLDPMVEEAIGAIVEKLAVKLATLKSIRERGSVVSGSFSVSVGDKRVLSMTLAEHLDNASGKPFYDKPEVVHALMAAKTDNARAALMGKMTKDDKARMLMMVRLFSGNAGNIVELIEQGQKENAAKEQKASGRKVGHTRAAIAAA